MTTTAGRGRPVRVVRVVNDFVGRHAPHIAGKPEDVPTGRRAMKQVDDGEAGVEFGPKREWQQARYRLPSK